jgi:hypothetical protein
MANMRTLKCLIDDISLNRDACASLTGRYALTAQWDAAPPRERLYMPKSNAEGGDRTAELLEKLLVMHAMGATQEQIAKTVGRQKLWVNGLVKKVPRRSEV